MGYGGYIAFKLLGPPTKDAPASPAAPKKVAPIAPVEPAPRISKTVRPSAIEANPPTSSGKTIFDQIQQPPAAPAHKVSQPDFSAQKDKDASQQLQGFTPGQLRLESASRLLLTLKNEGGKVIYRRVSVGPNNEVTVTHVLAAQPLNSLLPEYPTGSEIHFHLDADNVIGRTFQFTLYYGDLQGNLYRQDVSGLGKEYPIVDPVVHIA